MHYSQEHDEGESPRQPPKAQPRSLRKCIRCREMRLKCTPQSRSWPGSRCIRCERVGHPCGPNLTMKEARNLYNQSPRVSVSNSSHCTSCSGLKERQDKPESNVQKILNTNELAPIMDLTECPNPAPTSGDINAPRNAIVHSQQQYLCQGADGGGKVPGSCFARTNLGDDVDRWIEKLDYLLLCNSTLEGTKALSCLETNERSGSYVTLQFQWRRLIDELEWTMVRLSDLADTATRNGHSIQADRILTSTLDALRQCSEVGEGIQTTVLCKAVFCYRKMGSEARMQKALRQLSALDAKTSLNLEFNPSALLARSLLKTSPVVASSFASQGTSAIGTRVRCPALHESLRCENPQVILEVLRIVLAEKEKDPDEGLDSRDTLGRTPLFLAAALRNEELCDSLIRAGAHVDAADYDGHTVLEVAARNGLLKTVSTLLEPGANVNQPIIHDGMAPLQAATALGHAEAVNFLLRHGAQEKTISVSTEKTATQLALENGHYDIAKAIEPQKSLQNSYNVTKFSFESPLDPFFDEPCSEDSLSASGYSGESAAGDMMYGGRYEGIDPFSWLDQQKEGLELNYST